MGDSLRSWLGFLPVVIGVADKVCGRRIAQFSGEVFSQNLRLSDIGVVIRLIAGGVIVNVRCNISVLLGELCVKALGRMPDGGQFRTVQRRDTFCGFLQEGLVRLFGIAVFFDDTTCEAAHGSVSASFWDNGSAKVTLRQIFIEQVLI